MTSATVAVSVAMSTPFPTIAQTSTETAVVVAESSEYNSVTGITIGIVLATLLLAGILTWMGTREVV